METLVNTSAGFREGMMVSDLREMTSIGFINTLRENDLISINRKGQICLTSRGKIASRLGVNNYLKLEMAEKRFLDEEIQGAKVENRGLFMVFGGMFISLLLIIGFWIIELKGF
jgi:hypothetical protein